MTLQFIYVLISIFGWYKWTRKKDHSADLLITKSLKADYFMMLIGGLALSLIFYFPLNYFESSLPVLDSLTNGFAIVATYLAAKKKLENWLLWIPIDLVISGIMLYKGMIFYAVLYICYTLFAIYGYYQWKKQLQ